MKKMPFAVGHDDAHGFFIFKSEGKNEHVL